MSSRRVLRCLVGALVVALGVVGLPALAAEAAPKVAAATAADVKSTPDVKERPDAVSALVTARVTGHRVEDLSQRTETDQVFANPDGSWTSESAASPVRTRDAHGNWADIDLSLEKVAGGYAPANAIGHLLISGGGDQTFAQMTVDGRNLAWKWPGGVLPAPTVVGNTATYAGVVPGGDLVLTATASGFRHDIVLHQAPAAPVSFQFPVVTGGPAVTKKADGGIAVTTKGGHPLVSAAKPVMYDAADPATGQPKHQVDVDTKVTKTATGAVVTLDPTEAFLNDPSTTYPVTIDPTYNSTNPNDTWIYDANPTAVHPYDQTLYAGTPDAGTTRYRSFIEFDQGQWQGATVSSATLTLRNFSTSTCSGAAVQIRRIAGAWTPGSVDWSNQPVTATDTAVTNAAAYGASGCPAADVSWNVTGIVQQWASWATNYGFQVRAYDETKTASYREYRAAGYTYTSLIPRLSVTYNHTPNTPTQPTTTGVSTYAAHAGDPVGNYIQNLRPTFSSIVSDADGGSVQGIFQVATSPGGTPVTTCTSPAVGSGTTASCTLSSNLTDGTTYYVRAAASDGSASSGWSSSFQFTVAAAKPAAPVVTCPDPYTDGSWATTAPGGSITCTIAATGTGASAPGSVKVSVDHGTPTQAHIVQSSDASIAQTTVTVSGADGGHDITATAVSPSGVSSDPADYGFGFGNVGMSSPAAGQVETTTDMIGIDAAGPPYAAGDPGDVPTATVKWRIAGSGDDYNTGWTEDTNTGLNVTNSTAGVHVTGAWDTRHATTDSGSGTTLDPNRPYLLDIEVCIGYPGAESAGHCTWSAGARQVLRVAHAFGAKFPTTDVPGGQVALWTGEFAASATDATVGAPGADLSISRTAASFAGAGEGAVSNLDTQVFGPGWTASLDGPEVGLGDMTLVDNTLVDGTLQLVDGLGNVMVFGPSQTPERRTTANLATPAGGWVALDEDTQLAGTKLNVSGTGASTVVDVTEDDGTVTRYTAQTAPTLTGAGVFTVDSINEAGTEGATTYSYDSAGRVTRMLAPVPAGVSCPNGPNADASYTNPATLPAGCRAMTITYAATTTASATNGPGDIAGQVKSIAQVVGGSTQPIPILASYVYDANKRLISVTDPRNNLTTAYTYDGDSTRIASVKPAGLDPINYAYAATSHKLARVTRVRPSTDAAGGTATLATIVYDIPTSGHTGLPDLDQNAVSAWGQTDAPTYGTAFFGPDQPLTSAGTSVSVDDVDNAAPDGTAWADADLSYTDADGREVNTAENGAGGWQYTSTSYDEHDNPVRQLDEGDIAAIQTGALPASEAGTLTAYNAEVKDSGGAVILPAGSVVTDTYGTARLIRTDSGPLVLARAHTHTDYDQGAPNSDINPATGLKYTLPTTVTTDAVDPSTNDVLDTYSKVTTDYSSAVSGDPVAGWKLHLAGATTTVMAGSAGSTTSDITTQTRYDATGRLIQTRQPTSNGTDDGTRNTYYYTADPQTAAPACGGNKAWAGALCQTTYAGTSPTLVTTTITAYDDQLSPLTTKETSGSDTRTTTNTYRADGAPTGTTITTSGITGSTPVGATTLGYDPGTGLQTTTTTAAAGGNPGGTITTGYDTWGRQITYTPAVGETTTTNYAASGELASVKDPQGTTSYTYDGTDLAGNAEHRGLLTKVSVSRPGGDDVEVTGAYDASGALVSQKLPGGITERMSFDTAGEPTGLSYSGTVNVVDPDPDTGAVTGTDPDSTWLGWTQENDALGRVRREWTPNGAAFSGDTQSGAAATGFARDYTYDRASRLVHVQDQTVPVANAGAGTTDPDDAAGLQAITACQIRDYTFDANGNRTGLTRTTASAGAACPTSGGDGAVTKTWTYDAGDRLTTAPGGESYVYDSFGRTTTIPEADTPAAASSGTPGDVNLSYYDDDSIKSLTQAGTTTTFGLDPAGRRSTATTTPVTGSATTIEQHYVDDSDNPGWAATTTGTGTPTIERYASDLSGNLGLTITGSDVSLDVTDLHGDVVSQIDVPTSGAATGITSWSDTDEYGNPVDSTTTGTTPTNTAGVSSGTGYGWLGSKQRATDSTGLILMGARVYNPCAGSFTSTDPVFGGNSTAYAYPQDPVNTSDLDGDSQIADIGGGGPTIQPPKQKEKHSLIGGLAHTTEHAASASMHFAGKVAGGTISFLSNRSYISAAGDLAAGRYDCAGREVTGEAPNAGAAVGVAVAKRTVKHQVAKAVVRVASDFMAGGEVATALDYMRSNPNFGFKRRSCAKQNFWKSLF